MTRGRSGRTRYPFANLAAALPGHELDARREYLAGLLGVPMGEIHTAMRDGLSIATADEWAVRAGFHPATLWPSWCDDAVREPGCRWCGALLPFDNETQCGSATCRRGLNTEMTFIHRRAIRWWIRLDRYRRELGMVAA